MRTSRQDLHSVVGAYALDALAGSDLFRFERHLARCARCASEFSALREAAACLAVGPAAGPAEEPPPGLTERAVAAAARTRQLPREAENTGSRSGRKTAAGRSGAGRRALRMLRPARTRLALSVAAAAVIAAAALGVAVSTEAHRFGEQESRAHAIAAVLAAPDATVLRARGTTGGSATIVMSARRHALIFTATRLPKVPSSERYELWLMGPSGDRPAGMLPGARHGMTGPVIAWGLRPGDRLGLTVEPARGSRRPSSAMILTLAL